jgi:hypothetical protein
LALLNLEWLEAVQKLQKHGAGPMIEVGSQPVEAYGLILSFFLNSFEDSQIVMLRDSRQMAWYHASDSCLTF